MKKINSLRKKVSYALIYGVVFSLAGYIVSAIPGINSSTSGVNQVLADSGHGGGGDGGNDGASCDGSNDGDCGCGDGGNDGW